jgi:hypothetical protein
MSYTIPAPFAASGLSFRHLWRAAAVALLLIIAITVLVAATPQGRAAARAMLFVPQVLPAIPFKPLEWFTADPIRQEVTYPLQSGQGVADLYVPSSGGKHSAILLFLGVSPAGRDDPRVVGLANALARTGVVVMIPWSDTMTQKRVATEEIDNLVRGFQYLRSLEVVDPSRVGMGGFCVGASLATVAAQDPRIRDQVRFVNFFGGYYDAEDLIKSVVTGTRSYNGTTEPWQPDPLSVEVVQTHLIEGIALDEERQLLSRAFIDNSVELNGRADTLSQEALAVYKLLSEPEISEVDRLMSQLPPQTLESIRRISPSTNIENLKAKVLIMHDRQDALVPSEESRRMAEAVGSEYYTEFSFFQHMDPTRTVSPLVYIREGFKLYMHMYNIMRELP